MKPWPSRWQRFWFRLFNRWMIRNGFLTGYCDVHGNPETPSFKQGNVDKVLEQLYTGHPIFRQK